MSWPQKSQQFMIKKTKNKKPLAFIEACLQHVDKSLCDERVFRILFKRGGVDIFRPEDLLSYDDFNYIKMNLEKWLICNYMVAGSKNKNCKEMKPENK